MITNPITISEAVSQVGKTIDELVTSKEEKGRIDLELQKLQTVINEKESEHSSLFVSGWRPFIGWICGVGLGFNFVLRPLINYVLLVFFPQTPIMESLEVGALMTLITGMLGFGTIRTYEKIKGVQRNGLLKKIFKKKDRKKLIYL